MTFEGFTVDTVNRAAAETLESASGKSINVARVLHTLGHEVLATGFLGGDSGAMIRRDLEAAGIAEDFIEVGARTRTCTTIIDRSAGTATELVEEPRAVEAEAWEKLLEKLRSHLPNAAALVLSGSLAPGGPEDFYARGVRLAWEAKVPVILDGRGRPLELALPERPFLVKPNRAELAATFGGALETEAAVVGAARRLVGSGAAWAVITMGAEGCVVCDGARDWRIRPPAVRVVNPIGSGDAMAAGIAAALTVGKGVPEACCLGTACAVANALTAVPGHLRREDVGALLPMIGVEAIEAGLA